MSLLLFITSQTNGSSSSLNSSAALSKALSIPLEVNPLQIDTAPNEEIIEEVVEELFQDVAKIYLKYSKNSGLKWRKFGNSTRQKLWEIGKNARLNWWKFDPNRQK